MHTHSFFSREITQGIVAVYISMNKCWLHSIIVVEKAARNKRNCTRFSVRCTYVYTLGQKKIRQSDRQMDTRTISSFSSGIVVIIVVVSHAANNKQLEIQMGVYSILSKNVPVKTI